MTEHPDLVRVELLGLPVPLWQRSQEHTDELIREFTLIASERRYGDSEQHAVPHRLIALIDDLTTQYSGFSEANEQQLVEAAARGSESLDLVYVLPPAAGQAAEHLGQLLDEADEYCRRGQHLLTLATPEDQAAFRRWFLEEFPRQIAGAEPRPWTAYSAAH
ncbi:MAG TPA: hypothetical protein VFT62_10950 [Mycobacteriales bacterium]|nr:hypothetical protein [Mycobacteriales bacterium]